MNEENTLNNQEVEVSSSIELEEKETFTKLDGIISIVSVILGFLFIRFAVVNTTGFITTIVFDLIATVGIIYIKKNGYTISKKNIINLVVIYLFSLVYSITANDFIKFLNSVFLILQTTYTVYKLCDEQSKTPRFYFYAQMKSLFRYPFANFGKCPKAITSITFKGNFGGNLKWIIIGLLVTTPVTLIVANLLVSADEGIEKILSNFTDWFFNNLNFSLIIQIMFGFLVGCGIFSMMYTNIYKKNFSPYDDTTYEIKFNNYRICPSVMIYSALTPLCLLYIMYIVSQIGYFIDAFSGNLYEGYTYSEYARRGFFELTAIACINLTVISLANTFCKRMGNSYNDKKPLVLKVYSIVFNIFTIFIISTAMSKMFLYIGEYGLTRLRVYTSWFMILLGLVFIMLIVREFKEFNISSVYKAAFTLMFGILCFSRVDSVIVKNNIYLYENGYIESLDAYNLVYDTSYDGLTPLLEYYSDKSLDEETPTNDTTKLSKVIETIYNDLNYEYSKYDRYNLSAMEFIKIYEKYYQ